MTDSDDKLSRRYRELAREEPPAQVDAAILAAARRSVSSRPRSSTWMGPVSIAAVLVLGIGVSLRMQMEKPGIETALPAAPLSEYSVPQAEAPPPAPALAPAPAQAPTAADSAAPAAKVPSIAAAPAAPKPQAPRVETQPPKALAKERVADTQLREEAKRNVAPEPNPFTDAPVTMQAPLPVSPPITALSAATPAPAEPSRSAASPSSRASAPAAAAPPPPMQSAPQEFARMSPVPVPQAAPQPAPLRAKRADSAAGALAGGASGERELRKAEAAADPDPLRELERIAGLRAAGNHAGADRALEQFRRQHPDFRIPEATWERVKPRPGP